MEKNKYTLITIVILLVVILPGAIYGSYIHFKTTTNFKRQFKFNGKLYFYDNKKLLGTYTCQTNRCDYAIYENEQKSTIINNNYAFIRDGSIIKLYNVKGKATIGKYESVNIGENNNYYVMKDGKWGAIEITTAPINKVDAENGYDEVKYHNGKYIAVKDGISYIVSNNEVLFETPYTIKDFNDKYIIVISDSSAYTYYSELVYDYENTIRFLDYENADEITIIDDYFLIKRNYNYVLASIVDDNEIIVDSFYYSGEDELTYEIKDNSLIFTAGEYFEKTIELNTEV